MFCSSISCTMDRRRASESEKTYFESFYKNLVLRGNNVRMVKVTAMKVSKL